MSALPPKADMCAASWHVRFVPEPDLDGSATNEAGVWLLDHLVGDGEEGRRHVEAE
jgi:hypothetical protein